MSVSPYERNELFRGQPLRPSQVRDTVKRLSPAGGQYYSGGGGGQFSGGGGGQFYGGGGGQFDQWGNPLYSEQSQFAQRQPIYSGGYYSEYPTYGEQRFIQRPVYGGGSGGGYGGTQWAGSQYGQYGQYNLPMRERFVQRQPRTSYYAPRYQAPIQQQFIRKSFLPEVTHVHQPEIIREVVEEDRPLIREVVHVQHRPITVKDVFLKEPAPSLPPLEKRRIAPPELMREVVHEVKPVIREVVHHERRPVIVREKYAVERQPEVRHFSETLLHKHMPGEICSNEPLQTTGYETVGEIYGQPMSSSGLGSQSISSQ